MLIGGFEKLTLVDYPGKVAATIFTVGCNFRCPFCHNPELVLPELIQEQPKILEQDILEFLQKKQGLIQGICITGGEPTLQSDLKDFILKIKNLGYAVKLDTNGSNPQVLQELINEKLVDYVAMDIKTSLEKYDLCTLGQVPQENIMASIQLLKQSNIDYEFRTTMAPGIVEEKDILKIVELIKGSPRYFLQRFKPSKSIDNKFTSVKPIDDNKLLAIASKIKPNFGECELR